MIQSPVLSIRPFRDLWLGQAISQLGDAFYYVIFMFMVKRITGSNEMVGFVGAVEALPYLLFGPYAGVIADRADRRRIMLYSDTFSGGILLAFAAFLALGHMPSSWLILVLAFTTSTIRVFFMPAKGAAVPSLVPAELMLRANALSATTQNMMPLIGLSLSAGVLSILYRVSPTWFFCSAVVLNGLSFLGSAFYIAKLPQILPDREVHAEVHAITDFKEGLRYIRSRHELTVLIVLMTIFRLMVAPFFVVYIAANDQWFGGRPETLAYCEISFFLAMLIASPLVGRFKIVRPGLWLTFGLAIIGITVAAMSMSTLVLAFCFWNFLAGLGVPCADIPMNTYMQVSVPDAFRGRVNSVMNMISTGVMPIGTSMGGIMVHEIGLKGAFLVMGFGMVAACFVGLLDSRFRAIQMPSSAMASAE